MSLCLGRQEATLYIYKQSTPEIPITDAVWIALLPSIQASGEEVLPIIEVVPLIVSDLCPDAMSVISHGWKGVEDTPTSHHPSPTKSNTATAQLYHSGYLALCVR